MSKYRMTPFRERHSSTYREFGYDPYDSYDAFDIYMSCFASAEPAPPTPKITVEQLLDMLSIGLNNLVSVPEAVAGRKWLKTVLA